MLSRRLIVAALLTLLSAGSSLQAQTRSTNQGIQDILDYIEKAWPALTRSMDDCKTVVEEKFTAQSVMYVPADIPVPQKASDLVRKCNVRVQPLPEVIHKLGTADLSKIKQPGLLYLPNPYVVPGGFFNEMYGWDSYFIIRGLVRAGKTELARGMVENFFYEIDHYGAVLNANRTYYLTRSQPPFLSSMVMAVYEADKAAGKDDKQWLARSYNYIARDHEVWTTGEKLAGSTGLSRYFDFGEGPVPESFGHEDNFYDAVARWFIQHPDQANGYIVAGDAAEKLPNTWPKYTVQLCGGMDEVPSVRSAAPAQKAPGCQTATRISFTPDYYKGDRAMRESGYDISFRYGPFSGSTHHFAGVDLNSLLYKEEKDLEEIANLIGKSDEARQWAEKAESRRETMNRLMWDEQKGMYFDYDFTRSRRSDYVFVTTFHALWAGVASPQQAKRMQQNLNVFEEPGGLVTSRNTSKVQWDFPWGWAPNELIGMEGLRRYGFNDDANRIAFKFMGTVLENFRRDGTIREKYNVVTRSSEAEIQAGYKQNVIGFGWTNGTFLEMLHQVPQEMAARLGQQGASAASKQ